MPLQPAHPYMIGVVPYLCTARAAWMGWAAGLLDGEGCIGIEKQQCHIGANTQRRLDVRIFHEDREHLEWVCGVVGLHAPIHKFKQGRNDQPRGYVLTFTADSAALVLFQLLPFLVGKHREALEALEYWAKGQSSAAEPMPAGPVGASMSATSW